ncbi:MAG: PEP-CTERM sorting domain-containing protein [Nitrospirae bacterium]|nr:PEP-CTERM sorting domain-containing protein [Nitrospirota bacterium]
MINRAITVAAAIVLMGGLLTFESSAVAVNPGTDTYTNISTQGQLGSNYPFYSDDVLNGPVTITNTHHYETNTNFTTPGTLDGQGTADFGTLKSRIYLQGPAALGGWSGTKFNEHWTVTNPSLTGSMGTMQLSFDLSGTTTVLDTSANLVTSDAFAAVALMVNLNPSSSSNGTSLLNYSTNLSSGPFQVTGTQNGPTVTIPFHFTYGTPFGIQTALHVSASTDNKYFGTTFSPYFEYYGGGTIDSVTVDFANTAELAGIVIPGLDPATSIRASSLTDYSGLLTESLPIPEPASFGILLGGLLLGWVRRRKIQKVLDI